MISYQFMRFCLVGTFGFLVDAGVLFLILQVTEFGPYVARVFSYITAASFTWIFNRNYTFTHKSAEKVHREWMRYISLCAFGGLINYSTYAIFIYSFAIGQSYPVLGVALGSIFGLVFNFLASKHFIFTQHKATFSTNAKAVFISLCVPIMLSLVFLMLNLFAVNLSSERIQSSVRLAFEQGELLEKDRLDGDAQRGADQFNDCLIITMALLRSQEMMKDALSPLMIPKNPYKNPHMSICDSLHQLVNAAGIKLDDSEQYERYHRYLHGHRTLAAIFLNVTDLTTTRFLLKSSVYGLLILLFVYGLYKIIRIKLKFGGNFEAHDEMIQGGSLIILALGFFMFYGLTYFGQSFTHAPFAILMLLFILLAFKINLMRCSLINLYVLVAIFGSVSMYFEFLSGPLPLGFAVVLGVISILWKGKDHIEENLRRSLFAVTVFMASALICYIVKLAITSYVFDEAIFSEVKNGLLFRTGTSSTYNTSLSYKIIDAINQLRWNLGQIGWGSEKMGYSAIGFCILQIIVVSPIFMSKKVSSNIKARILMLFLSVLGISAWYAIFLNHTVEHAWFMVRLLVWPIISGWLLWWILALEFRKEALSNPHVIAKVPFFEKLANS